MSALLTLHHYCLEKLQEQPPALAISQPLTPGEFTRLANMFITARFEAQQRSILLVEPTYGKGWLWHYEIVCIDPSLGYRIERHEQPTPSARELILLASVSEAQIPFPYSKQVFTSTQRRMLGKDQKKRSTLAPTLRPAVATVQYSCQGGPAHLRAMNLEEIVQLGQ